MRSPTGRTWRIVALAGSLTAGLVWAAPAWLQEFDDQVPGQTPAGWRVGWGNPGDDLLLVSNLRSLSGSRSLLLDRLTGEQSPMAGYSTRFPNVTDDWVHFSFAFLVQGKADAVRFGFELRGADPGERLIAIGIDGRTVSLATADGKERAPLGTYLEDGWHQLSLALPTRGGGQDHATASLSRRTSNGEWQNAGPAGRVPCRVPNAGYGTFMVVTYPGKRGYLLFLDDLLVLSPPPLPPG